MVESFFHMRVSKWQNCNILGDYAFKFSVLFKLSDLFQKNTDNKKWNYTKITFSPFQQKRTTCDSPLNDLLSSIFKWSAAVLFEWSDLVQLKSVTSEAGSRTRCLNNVIKTGEAERKHILLAPPRNPLLQTNAIDAASQCHPIRGLVLPRICPEQNW